MRLLTLALLVGCAHAEPSAPEPMEPDEPSTQPEPSEPEEPDATFVREFDECWRTYKECLKSKPDKVCFPPQEKCAIEAYRKLKKARGT